MRLGCSTGLTHRHHQGGLEATGQATKNVAHPVGINIVEEMEGEPLVVVLERANHQGRTKATASDPNPQHIRKRNSTRCLDLTMNDTTPKSLDVIDFAGDMGP